MKRVSWGGGASAVVLAAGADPVEASPSDLGGRAAGTLPPEGEGFLITTWTGSIRAPPKGRIRQTRYV